MNALTFAQPLLLWGLGLLPLLWLLLRALPPKIREVTFPGFIFLEDLDVGREVPHKAPWWLVLLRMAIITCITFGLAGPVYNAAEQGIKNDPLLIVIDNSWLAAAGWSGRQSTLLQWARELEGTSRQIYVIKTSADPLSPEPADIPQPITAIELEQIAQRIKPSALTGDYNRANTYLDALISTRPGTRMEIRWLSDDLIPAVDRAAYTNFASALQKQGDVTIWRAPRHIQYFIASSATTSTGLKLVIRRMAGRAGSILETSTHRATAYTATGAALSSADLTFDGNTGEAAVDLRLPVKIANKVAYVRLESPASAGSIHLLDARSRRADTGLVTSTDTENDSLLDGSYYLTRAVEPFARLRRLDLEAEGAIENDVVIFDDQGRLSSETTQKVANWVRDGGILIQFAGPRLADSAVITADANANNEGEGEGLPALLPAPLRRASRRFGGALSWQSAQSLGAFTPGSPLGDLTPDKNVKIDRQLLLDPGGLAQAQIWASLADGTPLVTARESGDGLLVFFHVTAAPGWSTLPLSQNFVDMLRRIMALAIVSRDRIEPDQRVAPRLYLDGFGRLKTVPPGARPVAGKDIMQGPSATFPPGYYGDPAASIAVNAVRDNLPLARPPLNLLKGVSVRDYELHNTRRLASWLFVIALILFLIDSVLGLWLGGSMRNNRSFLPRILKDTSTVANAK